MTDHSDVPTQQVSLTGDNSSGNGNLNSGDTSSCLVRTVIVLGSHRIFIFSLAPYHEIYQPNIQNVCVSSVKLNEVQVKSKLQKLRARSISEIFCTKMTLAGPKQKN